MISKIVSCDLKHVSHASTALARPEAACFAARQFASRAGESRRIAAMRRAISVTYRASSTVGDRSRSSFSEAANDLLLDVPARRHSHLRVLLARRGSRPRLDRADSARARYSISSGWQAGWAGDEVARLLKRMVGLLGKLEVKETSRPSPPRLSRRFDQERWAHGIQADGLSPGRTCVPFGLLLDNAQSASSRTGCDGRELDDVVTPL